MTLNCPGAVEGLWASLRRDCARGRAVAGLYVCLHEVSNSIFTARLTASLLFFPTWPQLLAELSDLNFWPAVLAVLCLSVMTVRDYFSRFFLPAFWLPASAFCLRRRITASPVARLTYPRRFPLCAFQGEGLYYI